MQWGRWVFVNLEGLFLIPLKVIMNASYKEWWNMNKLWIISEHIFMSILYRKHLNPIEGADIQ